MSQGYNKPNTGSGGDNIYQGFVKVNTCLDALLSLNYDSVAPATVQNGMIWMDSTDTTDLVGKLRENGAWLSLDIKYVLGANKDFNDYQALSMRVENLAGTPASATNKVGRLVFDTSSGYLAVDDFDNIGEYRKIISIAQSTGVLTYKELRIDPDLDLGSTPPTKQTYGTTPVIAGWLFDATAETITLRWRVPTNWVGNTDVTLDLICALNAAETANDDIDWTCDWSVIKPGSGNISGHTSATVADLTDVGSQNAQADVTLCQINIDHDEANNVMAAGDLCIFEIHRTNLTEIAGVVLLEAGISFYRDEL